MTGYPQPVSIRCRGRCASGWMVFLALSFPSLSHAASVDPFLLPLLSGQASADSLSPSVVGVLPGAPPSADPLISVTLRLSGRLEDLRPLGLRIGAVMGAIVTAEVTPAQLASLRLHPAVDFIELAKPLVPQLNLSAPLIGANQVWSRIATGTGWSGHTGRGVYVGIIDSGLDLFHDDFRDSDGKTRVVALWDQSTGAGRPPVGFSYGTECRPAEINTRGCPETDHLGHGTHVAGIAVGNGRATGREHSPYRYIGVAPEADIAIVKMGTFTTNRVIDALAYLDRKAAEAGKPLVVNASLGLTSGPHDGTSNFDQAINAFSNTGQRPGRAFVASSGNTGADELHTSGCLPVGSGCSGSIGFLVPSGATGLWLDLWYTGGAELGIRVNCPGEPPTAEVIPTSTGTTETFSNPCGTITVAGISVVESNGDGNIVVLVNNGSGVKSGAWSLSLAAYSLPSSGTVRYDVWSGSLDSGDSPTFTGPDPHVTLGSPATATSAIAVVPWVSKLFWTSTIGPRSYCRSVDLCEEKLADLATAAGQGPRRTCSLASACPFEPKPDLAAPGFGVMSSLSAKADASSFLDQGGIEGMTDPDGVHFIQAGSSMAAPHVTGTIALMLQINPTMTANEVKNLLRSTADAPIDSVVPANEISIRWGAGKLNAKAATMAVTDVPPVAPSGLRVVSVRSRYVALVWDGGADLDLRGYKVYRRPESSLVSTLLTFSPVSALTFEDTDELTNETAYRYTITAVDIAGRESAASDEARGVPTAGEGSVGFCFIATAAYGTPWHPRVAALRTFRDHHLRTAAWGRVLVAAYERWSPPAARLIASHAALRSATRAALAPVIVAVERPRAGAAVFSLGVLGLIVGRLRRRPPA